MTNPLTWDEVLKRTDLIGGDIEVVEDSVQYRGPLSKIEYQGEVIQFTSPWCARLTEGGWQMCPTTPYITRKDSQPTDIGSGRVHFSLFMLGVCTLFPKSGSKLNPDKVRGLPKASERLLALYPDLRFDREIASKVLAMDGCTDQIKVLAQLPSEASLRDLLATFRQDYSAETFLWSYIERTVDTSVWDKVY